MDGIFWELTNTTAGTIRLFTGHEIAAGAVIEVDPKLAGRLQSDPHSAMLLRRGFLSLNMHKPEPRSLPDVLSRSDVAKMRKGELREKLEALQSVGMFDGEMPETADAMRVVLAQALFETDRVEPESDPAVDPYSEV